MSANKNMRQEHLSTPERQTPGNVNADDMSCVMGFRVSVDSLHTATEGELNER